MTRIQQFRTLRERVLRQCVDSMVNTRPLRTERQTITEDAHALEELLTSTILSEWQASPTGQPIRQRLSFSHNLLFDFAADQVYLPYECDAFVSLLVSIPDLAIQSVPLTVVAEGASIYRDVEPLSRELMNLTSSLHKIASAQRCTEPDRPVRRVDQSRVVQPDSGGHVRPRRLLSQQQGNNIAGSVDLSSGSPWSVSIV